jgi:molybdate transport system substrate-binding protein
VTPRPRIFRSFALFLACVLLQGQARPVSPKPAGDAGSAELIVMTSGTFTAAHLELAPAFERSAHVTITTAATTLGVGADSIPSRMQREAVDIVIVAADTLDDLIRNGLVIAGSRVDLGRSSIGMAVRAGAPKPDIRSVTSLKQTLLNAKSVALSSSVSGDYFSKELFLRLGIAEQMAPKTKRIVDERVGAVVARGDAEIGFQQMSELLPIAGIDVVGPLPSEVQRVTVFAAGVAASSRRPDVARAYIRFLASAEAWKAVASTGLER